MDDKISRQAALKSQIKMVAEGLDWIPAFYIEQLPSAERRGRWEKIELSAPSGGYVMFQCSECASLYYEPSSYCPNCGARMEASK